MYEKGYLEGYLEGHCMSGCACVNLDGSFYAEQTAF